jgi:hypothetical protein
MYEAIHDGLALFDHRANGCIAWVTTGSHRFLRNPSCTFALVTDPGRIAMTHLIVMANADPIPNKMKSPTGHDIGTQSYGFGTCCLRFKSHITITPARLASG